MRFADIKTSRCRLRGLRETDLPAFAKYRSDPQVARYQDWNCPYSIDEARELFNTINAVPFGTRGSWYQIAITKLKTDELVGDLAIHFAASRQIELGFTIAPKSQRMGYAKEAIAPLLSHLFQRLKCRRVLAIIDARNAAAAALLRSLGFKVEPDGRRRVLFKGKNVEEHLFVCSSGEWVRGAGAGAGAKSNKELPRTSTQYADD